MKMIDVLNMMSKNEIKEGTKLIIGGYMFDYVKRWLSETSVSYRFEYGKGKTLEDYYDIDINFLNKEVGLIPPKPKKYYLRLDKDDNFSYINKNVYFSYEVANKSEHTNYKTKFTQEEIDESMLLKFIERHGVKEEVEENEND